MLEAHHTGLVDDKGFGHAINAVVNAHAAIGIHQRGSVGVAHLRQQTRGGAALVFVVQAVKRRQFAPCQLHQKWVLLTTRHTPRGPDIEHPHLAAQVFGLERAASVIQLAQRKGGRRSADERRRHFAGVQVQAFEQKRSQGQKKTQRQQELQNLHACAPCAASVAATEADARLATR